jgi:hypothetical protein
MDWLTDWFATPVTYREVVIFFIVWALFDQALSAAGRRHYYWLKRRLTRNRPI